MKKSLIIFTLLALMLMVMPVATTAQNTSQIWKYDTDGAPRTTFSSGTFTWYTAGADSVTTAAFGPGPLFQWSAWNGLLGQALQVDTVAGTTTADTLYFYLIHNLGVNTVKEPDTLNWKNANDSTETTSYIALPADHGKIWIWQSNPTGHYLQKFPDNKYYVRMFSTAADTADIKQQFFVY